MGSASGAGPLNYAKPRWRNRKGNCKKRDHMERQEARRGLGGQTSSFVTTFSL